MLAERVEIVIGVDTHKHTHTAAVVTAATGAAVEDLTVSTDPSGYQLLVDLADRHGQPRLWAIEGTGGYGAGLTRHLRSLDFDRCRWWRPGTRGWLLVAWCPVGWETRASPMRRIRERRRGGRSCRSSLVYPSALPLGHVRRPVANVASELECGWAGALVSPLADGCRGDVVSVGQVLIAEERVISHHRSISSGVIAGHR
jgi:hypothetical protein